MFVAYEYMVVYQSVFGGKYRSRKSVIACRPMKITIHIVAHGDGSDVDVDVEAWTMELTHQGQAT